MKTIQIQLLLWVLVSGKEFNRLWRKIEVEVYEVTEGFIERKNAVNYKDCMWKCLLIERCRLACWSELEGLCNLSETIVSGKVKCQNCFKCLSLDPMNLVVGKSITVSSVRSGESYRTPFLTDGIYGFTEDACFRTNQSSTIEWITVDLEVKVYVTEIVIYCTPSDTAEASCSDLTAKVGSSPERKEGRVFDVFTGPGGPSEKVSFIPQNPMLGRYIHIEREGEAVICHLEVKGVKHLIS